MSDKSVKTQRFFAHTAVTDEHGNLIQEIDEIVLCVNGPQQVNRDQVEQWLNRRCDGLQPKFQLQRRSESPDSHIRASFQLKGAFTSMLVLELVWPNGKPESNAVRNHAIRSYVTRLNTLEKKDRLIAAPTLDAGPLTPGVVFMDVAVGTPFDVVASEGSAEVFPAAILRGMLPDAGSTLLTFVAASPNWLFVGSEVQLVGGGPGGIPVVPRPDPEDPEVPKREDYTLHFGSLDTGQQMQNACPVVVIFDTVPPEKVWQSAVTHFQDQDLLKKLHPDVAAQPIRIIRANDTFPARQLPNDNIKLGYAHEPDYDMSDHGLFSAGLVRSAAPNAPIYLVEVLNRFGAGSFIGLIESLSALAGDRILDSADSNRPLILNLSLTISFKGLKSGTKPYTDLAPLFPPPEDLADVFFQVFVELTVELLRRAFEAVNERFRSPRQSVTPVRGHGVVIFAAAGNDGDPVETPPASEILEASETVVPEARRVPKLPRFQARFPAAFNEVIGVGALGTNGQDAFYSNLPDEPPANGVRTLGGNAVRHATLTTPIGNPINVSDQKTGLLGIYLGGIPDMDNATRHLTQTMAWPSKPIPRGWARWSGTSFAAAVMSAMTATAVCGKLLQFGSAEQVLNDLEMLVGAAPPPETATSQSGKRLHVTQG